MELKADKKETWWENLRAQIKFCFKCGGPLKKKFVREENRRRLKCERCGQITYLNPKVVAGLVPITKDGKIILLKRKIEPGKGRWSYPAGFVEMGESVAQAARRETWEEIRARVKVRQLVGIYAYKRSGAVTVVFAGSVLKGERPRPGVEAEEVRPFDFGKIPWDRLAFKSSVDALLDWEKSASKY